MGFHIYARHGSSLSPSLGSLTLGVSELREPKMAVRSFLGRGVVKRRPDATRLVDALKFGGLGFMLAWMLYAKSSLLSRAHAGHQQV